MREIVCSVYSLPYTKSLESLCVLLLLLLSENFGSVLRAFSTKLIQIGFPK